MASYYLDTSALVKCYALEAGTTWMNALREPDAGHTLYTVRLTGPELIAALSRKARTGEVTSADAGRAGQAVRRDWPGRYVVVAVSEPIAEQAMDLAERHGLRGYDAVHLATALAVVVRQRRAGAPILAFVSADAAQRRAAEAEGIVGVDPSVASSTPSVGDPDT